MDRGKLFKNIGIGIMMFGLVFMVIACIKTEGIKFVMLGLVIVSIGSLLSRYGEKQIPKQ